MGRYLEKHLMDILECYLENGQKNISRHEFKMIMKNSDVSNTLRQCGTDMHALQHIPKVLFPRENSKITLSEFFRMIVRLRAGTPASASHIASLSSMIEGRLKFIEDKLIFKRGDSS